LSGFQAQSDASAILGDELRPGALESLDHGAAVHGGEFRALAVLCLKR
jgi:hypothetical protein